MWDNAKRAPYKVLNYRKFSFDQWANGHLQYTYKISHFHPRYKAYEHINHSDFLKPQFQVICRCRTEVPTHRKRKPIQPHNLTNPRWVKISNNSIYITKYQEPESANYLFNTSHNQKCFCKSEIKGNDSVFNGLQSREKCKGLAWSDSANWYQKRKSNSSFQPWHRF